MKADVSIEEPITTDLATELALSCLGTVLKQEIWLPKATSGIQD